MLTPVDFRESYDFPQVGNPFLATLNSLSTYIANSPLAQDLSDQECKNLASVMYSRKLDKGEFLQRQGQVDDTLHLIVSGRLAVTKYAGASTLTLHILERGNLAGEMGFVDRQPHTASLVAMEPVTVLSLRREAFEQLLPDHPELVYHIMRAIVRLEHTTLGRMNLHFVEMHNYITKSNGRY